MSQGKLELIDSKLSVAPDGSKFINPEVRATLTETETTEINKALSNFNKLPEATKDGRDSAMQVLEQEISEVKQVAFGEISASAKNGVIFRQAWSWKNTWFGNRLIMNPCAAKNLSWQLGTLMIASALFAVFGLRIHPAAAIFFAITTAVIAKTIHDINYYADGCSLGAYVNFIFYAIPVVKSRCW